MTWTTPVNLATGDKVTDAIWNLQVIDNLTHLYTPRYVFLQDQKASGVSGGAFTSGAWRTRDLTVEVADTNNLCTLLANQITLAAGTYQTLWGSFGYNVGVHQSRLQNITAATTLILGLLTRPQAGGNNGTLSVGFGVFTLAAASVLELQGRCTTTDASGFGTASGWGTEIYSSIEFRKLD